MDSFRNYWQYNEPNRRYANLFFLNNETEVEMIEGIKFYNCLIQIVLISYPTLLFAVGIPGNVLTIIVLNRRSMKDNFVNIFLMWLAGTNLACLLISLSRHLVLGWTLYDYRLYSYHVCIFHRWISLTLNTMASWILVLVTGSRLYTLTFIKVQNRAPLKTFRMHLLNVIFLAALGCIDYVLLHNKNNADWKVWGKEGKILECEFPSKDAFAHLTQTLFGYAPCTSLFLLNTFIFIRYKKSLKETSNLKTSPLAKRRGNLNMQLTGLLVVANIQFLILNIPVSIYLSAFDPESHKISSVETAKMQLLYIVLRMLQYTDYAINFITYCCFGSRFRRELKRLLKSICRKLPAIKGVTDYNRSRGGQSRTRWHQKARSSITKWRLGLSQAPQNGKIEAMEPLSEGPPITPAEQKETSPKRVSIYEDHNLLPVKESGSLSLETSV